MKLIYAAIATLALPMTALAQVGSSASPFHDRDGLSYRSRGDSRYDDDARNDRRYHEYGPFTREEAEELEAVWPRIRQAADFEDIDWHAEGLAHAPGDRRARRFMARHWDSLRRAARFDDIDWDDVEGNS